MRDEGIFRATVRGRSRGDRAREIAAQIALHQVDQFMHTMGFGYRDLKVTVSDMSQVWATRATSG